MNEIMRERLTRRQMFLGFVDFIFDKQAEQRGHCAGCCYFFDHFDKMHKKWLF